MDLRTGVLFVTFLVGCIAVPTPEADISVYYEHADSNARIVGGIEAANGAHPHMVALTNGVLVRSFFCGGSIISPRTILTAAHCISAVYSSGALSSNLRGIVGTNRWNQGGELYAFTRNLTHQNYVSSTIKNDIGLLYTTTEIVFSSIVRSIPLSYQNIGAGIAVRAAGWGRIRAGGPVSATLLQLDIETISGQQCVEGVAQASIDFNQSAPHVEPHIELCTLHSPGFGVCNGDSGSALARVDSGVQIGIVSWGFPCARGAPDVFVRISGYQNWLIQNVIQ
ncbi:chymotrypsin-2-like [Galleria mellonella]|uniref:Chymotrypsin-2-like n=1 Tax=Galleria mellonella TaxID=7137 RepID=A0A6J1WFN9_GALME|nr:chymotrypsin-2-like [Galleria mellonella]